MNIGRIETVFEVKNFSTFKEWYDNYEKEVVIPAANVIYPDTFESRSLINSMVQNMNQTIKNKWIEYGCDMPEIKHVEITMGVHNA